MAVPADKVDLEARIRAARVLHEKFRRILEDIMEGKPPKLVIPKRTLANTIFDPKRGILLLGGETLEREFLDMGEARRFMQTLLMASIIYQALIENEYPTIRDLYYRGKHTIVYRDLRGRLREENTWDEQYESDAVIRDIEVYTGLLREDMLILSKEKGKVVGNMRIRSGGDVIDLSRLGHGAYAIESTPDLIEFVDWDAEFVLVVEKDAVFQQLHRIGFWKKYKAILVTGAGQPDRATRRFVRRLNEELGLPVYVLTDSIPADEVVLARGPDGLLQAAPIEAILSGSFSGAERERALVDLAVPAWNPVSGRIIWSRVGYAYRHLVDGEIVEIETRGRGTIRVTGGHSLYVVRDGRLALVTADEVGPGDYVVVAETIPSHAAVDTWQALRRMSQRCRAGVRILGGPTGDMVLRVLGLALTSGLWRRDRYVTLKLRGLSARRVEEYLDAIRKCGARGFIEEKKRELTIVVADKKCVDVAAQLGLDGEVSRRRIPSLVLSSDAITKLAFLRGIFEGAGRVDASGEIVLSIRGEAYAKQVFSMLLTLGVNPSVTKRGGIVEIRISPSSHRTPPLVYEAIAGFWPDRKRAEGPDRLYSIPLPEQLRRELRALHGGMIYVNGASRRMAKWKLRRVLGRIRGLRGLEPLVAGDAVVVEVTRVSRRRYSGYVYDLAVPGANTFIGSYGVVYHNSDPYGWYIYSVFKVGSIQLSYESERLATPQARFLGVSMTDVFGYGRKKPYLTEAERRNYIIKAKDADIKRAKELMNYSWFKSRGWRREIKIFLEKKAKLEIEALASKGLKFLAFKYLPEKRETGDWIE